MRVEIPLSIHGCYDVITKCGVTYVLTPYDTPLLVDGATEHVHPEHHHVRLYKVGGDHAIINGTHVKGREYHVSTCKLAFTTMCVKSAQFLPAWCAYHQHIGADFFLIYDNNSSEEEFEALVEAAKPFPGIIVRWNYPFVYGHCTQAGQQTHAICVSKYSIQRLGLTDMDEYLVIESGTLNELITPPITKVFWRWFGAGNGVSTDPRDYTRCARSREGQWYCKAICDPLKVDIGLIHNAYGPGIPETESSNASFYHYRGLTNHQGRGCPKESHEVCPYCQVENLTLVQKWPRSPTL
jgi:hypothetical protein